jgi:transposase
MRWGRRDQDEPICKRRKARRGPKKAVIAVVASILTAVYHMLKNHVPYHDLVPDHFVRRDPARIAAKLAQRIMDLGYEVQYSAAA